MKSFQATTLFLITLIFASFIAIKSAKLRKAVPPKIKLIFDSLKGSNKELNTEKLQKYLETMGNSDAEELAKQLMEKYDVDKSGGFNLNEFNNALS